MCVVCKGGRALCGHRTCPLLPRFSIAPKIDAGRREFFGPGHSVFVGRMGYPNVNVGPLVAIEEKPDIDSPAAWFGKDYGKVIELRSSLLRSKRGESVFSRSRFVADSQEIALASKPTDVEMKFSGKPFFRVSFSDVMQPMGPSVSVERLALAGNPKVPQHVEKLVSDELKAADSGLKLYERGEDVYRITSILSSGALGLEKNRKLVPTRWSVTASQTFIADRLIERVKQYPSINEYRVYSGQGFDNHFEILLMPGTWEFENFEAWSPGSMWAAQMKKTEVLAEYEPYDGRTKYAELQGGGFYSIRFGVSEALANMRRQAKVIVFREVYEGYVIPLGCWQIVENVRHAMRQNYVKFDTKEAALAYIKTKLRTPLSEYVKQSTIFRRRNIMDFMRHG
jgi:hypothetical protein